MSWVSVASRALILRSEIQSDTARPQALSSKREPGQGLLSGAGSPDSRPLQTRGHGSHGLQPLASTMKGSFPSVPDLWPPHSEPSQGMPSPWLPRPARPRPRSPHPTPPPRRKALWDPLGPQPLLGEMHVGCGEMGQCTLVRNSGNKCPSQFFKNARPVSGKAAPANTGSVLALQHVGQYFHFKKAAAGG